MAKSVGVVNTLDFINQTSTRSRSILIKTHLLALFQCREIPTLSWGMWDSHLPQNLSLPGFLQILDRISNRLEPFSTLFMKPLRCLETFC